MVWKAPGIRLVVIEDPALSINPGNPQISRGQFRYGLGILKNRGGTEHFRGDPQIPADLLLEQVIVYGGYAQGGQHQGHQRHKPQPDIDFLLHTPASGLLCST